jgi:5-methylthioadenosine/S-adenosylhomocysteine deaminase
MDKQLLKTLLEQEQRVLRKLAALGELEQRESFELQAKARLTDPLGVRAALQALSQGNNIYKPLKLINYSLRHEYDLYFFFDQPEENRLRLRKTHFNKEQDDTSTTVSELVLLGPAQEFSLGKATLLTRLRFAMPCLHPTNFYREYFNPAQEQEVEKERSSWRVIFDGVELGINLDRLIKPELGYFIEVKRTTWNRQVAEEAAPLIEKLLHLLEVSAVDVRQRAYVEWTV